MHWRRARDHQRSRLRIQIAVLRVRRAQDPRFFRGSSSPTYRMCSRSRPSGTISNPLRQPLEREVVDGDYLRDQSDTGVTWEWVMDHVRADGPGQTRKLDGRPPAVDQEVASAPKPAPGGASTPSVVHELQVDSSELGQSPLELLQVDRRPRVGRPGGVRGVEEDPHVQRSARANSRRRSSGGPPAARIEICPKPNSARRSATADRTSSCNERPGCTPASWAR